MTKSRKPRMADVARMAETSTGTVSRVLNGGYVAAETRQRVLEAMQALKFRPKYLANSKRRVCLYSPAPAVNLGQPYAAAILSGLSRRLNELGIQLMVYSATGSDDEDLGVLRGLRPDVIVSIGAVPPLVRSLQGELSGIILSLIHI